MFSGTSGLNPGSKPRIKTLVAYVPSEGIKPSVFIRNLNYLEGYSRVYIELSLIS